MCIRDRYIINGGKPICGSIETSGMKNSAVAILFGCLLINDTCIIENVPDIIDVAVSLEILSGVGVRTVSYTHLDVYKRQI